MGQKHKTSTINGQFPTWPLLSDAVALHSNGLHLNFGRQNLPPLPYLLLQPM